MIKNNTILLGRAFGIPIKAHISLVLLIILVPLLIPGLSFLQMLIFAVGIFGSVALHELGHSLVAQRKGSTVQEIVLYPFDGAAKMYNLPSKPMDEILVALAGPAVSLVLAVTCLQTTALWHIGYINAYLFFFNILPVFPMDGGRVLRAWLSRKKGRIEGTRIAASVGKYFCILFVIVGLFGFEPLQIRSNFMLAFIGFYIYRAGQMEYKMVLFENQSFQQARDLNDIEVEVSPPPYALHTDPLNNLKDRVNRFFQQFRK